MAIVTMKQLLESGVHFGHQTRRWNPKMKKYIFTERNGIYIIDLQKTVKMLEETYNYVRELIAAGGTVLFVGTKKQAQESIEVEAKRAGMFYVNQRWLGGMLTNFKTIRLRIDRLLELEKMEEEGVWDLLPKKEVIFLRREKEKLVKFMGGIRDMNKLPDAVYVVDPRKEKIVIAEARKLNIPIIGIVDTNCDPDEIDLVIPGNDDAIRAVKLITSIMANAVIEGKQLYDSMHKEEADEEESPGPGEDTASDHELEGAEDEPEVVENVTENQEEEEQAGDEAVQVTVVEPDKEKEVTENL